VTTLPGQVGGGGNRPGGIGGGNRPTGPGGATTLPGQIGGGGNRPGGIGGGNRPGIGGGNRPGGQDQIGTTKPWPPGGKPGEGGWNQGGRPGIGGNRPGDWNGNRPGDFNGNRPNWNNRPGYNGNNNNIGNNVNVNNNNFNNYGGGGWGGGYGGGYYGGGYGGGYNNGWNNGWSNWGAFGVGAGVGALAGWGLGNSYGYGGYGGGYGGYASAWNSGYVNPYYDNWYNGCWGNGWASPVAFGAATLGMSSMVSSWGLGSSSLGYATSYANPYYAAEAATVASASPYDYSQPIVVNNYITSDGGSATNSAQGGDGQGGDGGAGTAAAQVTPAQVTPAQAAANKALDEALGKFKQGDYPGSLASIDSAVKSSPNDTVLHEVRALALFALGRYPEAAATLNAVLAVAPGMDWTTMSSLYGSVDTYTGQLRKLEDFCRSNPGSAAGHFVLAYHYLVGGHADLAAEALKVVVAKQPGDVVSKRLLESLEPPAEATAEEVAAAEATKPAAAPAAKQPAAQKPAEAEAPAEAEPAGPETDLVGTWKATEGKNAVTLTIGEDSSFTWKAEPEGKPAVELKGTLDSNADQIALQTEAQGTMVANVKSKGPDAFDFLVEGAPKDAKPLQFARQK
jgi:tetratricopeptide (TPR) repeat protein